MNNKIPSHPYLANFHFQSTLRSYNAKYSNYFSIEAFRIYNAALVFVELSCLSYLSKQSINR